MQSCFCRVLTVKMAETKIAETAENAETVETAG